MARQAHDALNHDGILTIGTLKLGIWPSNIDTRAGALTASPGGNFTGTNQVWYDFDAGSKTITITWDDVGQATNGTTPNAMQVQLKLLDSGDFDVIYRYEAVAWAGSAPYIEIAGVRYNLPVLNSIPCYTIPHVETSACPVSTHSRCVAAS